MGTLWYVSWLLQRTPKKWDDVTNLAAEGLALIFLLTTCIFTSFMPMEHHLRPSSDMHALARSRQDEIFWERHHFMVTYGDALVYIERCKLVVAANTKKWDDITNLAAEGLALIFLLTTCIFTSFMPMEHHLRPSSDMHALARSRQDEIFRQDDVFWPRSQHPGMTWDDDNDDDGGFICLNAVLVILGWSWWGWGWLWPRTEHASAKVELRRMVQLQDACTDGLA